MNSTVSTVPALVFVYGPWLLLGLVLSGPFLALLTVIAALVAAIALIAGAAGLVAAPIVLFRHRPRFVHHPRPAFELEQVTA
jgi:hypothetical protein